MNQYPFSVFRKENRRFFYVCFKNEQTGKYQTPISTKKETKAEAIKVAFDWLRDGIPQKGKIINYKKYSLREMAKEADVSKADADFICSELKRRGFLKTHVLEGSKQAIDFISYLTDFWDWEKSPYIKEKLRRNHGLHKRYAIEMSGAIKKYWTSFFNGKILGEITRQDIEAFITHLETLPEQAKKSQEEIDKALKIEIQEGLKNPKRKNATAHSVFLKSQSFPETEERQRKITFTHSHYSMQNHPWK